VTWNQHHSRSERLAAEAESATRAGDADRAKELYRQAAAEESAAFGYLSTEKIRSRGITAVSAVSLFYKGQDYEAAERLARDYLGQRLPAFAESQMSDLLGRISEHGRQPKSSVQAESQFGQSGGPLRVPYVIDNQGHKLSDILNRILQEHVGRSLDSASAYFTVGGFGLLQRGLESLGNFRLILGAEPTTGEQLGLRPEPGLIKGLIKGDLESMPFDEKTLRLVEDLIAYLQRDSVQVRLYDGGFLHAKCWLFYSDRPGQQMLFDRFRPILAIVGSSNFTLPGLTSNRELNLAHKVLLDPAEVDDRQAAYAVSWLSDVKPSSNITVENRQLLKSEVGARAIIDLEEWYQRQWLDSREFKAELVDLLDASKFGQKEYTPYEVYMKALYEYFKDELDDEQQGPMRSAIELAEFQEDAVKKARKILARYDGVMIADSVGLGKTWIGKKLLEDYAYHMRQKALVVCPASLRPMWQRELGEATISAAILSQEELGREEFDPTNHGDVDVVLLDESHNFRNRNAQRFGNLERLLGANGGRGRDGMRKKVILLTATPVSNDLFDLYNQFSLITQGDRSYFAAAGIGDLYRYFLQARREARRNVPGVALFNLLEEVVIRRTRSFIRKAYPEATIAGKKIHFPKRELKTVQYNLEEAYRGIYEDIVSAVESLKLAPYNLEEYKKSGIEVDEFEVGREQALVGIFKSRYLKRFESSIEAFRISVRRALAFLQTFESYVLGGRLLKSSDFHKALQYLEREDVEDDAVPESLADDLDANEDARRVLESMGTVDPSLYDLRRLHKAVQHDVHVLTEVWDKVKGIGIAHDTKLERLKDLLTGDLKGQKVLIFSYYKDTARYLFRHLGDPNSADASKFRKQAGNVNVRRMDSGNHPDERVKTVQAFAPKANGRPEWAGTDREIDLLISTDVLSEGQNLQDCGYLLNYDLHWNPTRMVQRAGRIDRIGTEFDVLWIYNMFPDRGLERLLGLVDSLSRKIADIDRLGMLDASVLGEEVHPQTFNSLKRIREEDNTIIEEEEQFTELASSEILLQQLRSYLDGGGREALEKLPDGIHSGLQRMGSRGVFWYFRGKNGSAGQNFWKYYDLRTNSILDNRHVIATLISCSYDTARVVDQEIYKSIFTLQEKVIANLLEGHEEKVALQIAPQAIDPLQQTVSTVVQQFLNHPEVERKRAVGVIAFLNGAMQNVQVSELKRLYKAYQQTQRIAELMSGLETMRAAYAGEARASGVGENGRSLPKLLREDLKLVCFDVLSDSIGS
jgi:superfamily II DNA or RNA helicase